MSASQVLDAQLQKSEAVSKAMSSMDSSAAAEPSFSTPGVQPAFATEPASAAKPCFSSPGVHLASAAEPSAAAFRHVVQASNVQPPILDYSSKALCVESLAGYYGMFVCSHLSIFC
ncbi:hypothetical protein FN846DRAFT_887507 [Sphaerosporella brunnea]|uniref:Uncharacterized protein n=1 Tax=Sphaerosporella brunnea TaxID=1250544 RepID=A0A5J5F604_9PEZI|nr:hypothetical protein FN846DRAFT_887507 [Sphaerosporella brunnea]